MAKICTGIGSHKAGLQDSKSHEVMARRDEDIQVYHSQMHCHVVFDALPCRVGGCVTV